MPEETILKKEAVKLGKKSSAEGYDVMKRPDNSVLFGIRKGIAIYFNDVINKERIKEIVRMLVDMTSVSFTGKRAQGEPKIRLVRGGWERVFDNTFRSSTFDSSNVLMLTDGTKDALQTTQIYMNLWNPCRSASCILVDCMVDIDWEAIITFIQAISKMLPLQYVSAGYNVVSNHFWYPGSAAYSLKFLQTVKYANSEWTEWLHLGFVVNEGICGPNFIQFLSDKLWASVEGTVRQCDLICTPLHTGMIVDILDHKDGKIIEPENGVLLDRLSRLYRALYPIIVPVAKTMFLKEDEWAARQRRFE